MSSEKGGIAEQVILCVAEESNSDELDLPPLYNAVDPEALATVVETLTEGAVTFTYAGYSVTVDCEGEVRLDALNAGYSAPGSVAGDD